LVITVEMRRMRAIMSIAIHHELFIMETYRVHLAPLRAIASFGLALPRAWRLKV
jgi:hypothetical protein